VFFFLLSVLVVDEFPLKAWPSSPFDVVSLKVVDKFSTELRHFFPH